MIHIYTPWNRQKTKRKNLNPLSASAAPIEKPLNNWLVSMRATLALNGLNKNIFLILNVISRMTIRKIIPFSFYKILLCRNFPRAFLSHKAHFHNIAIINSKWNLQMFLKGFLNSEKGYLEFPSNPSFILL